jgi:hypothetical protein
MNYPIHPAANIFPLMTDEEYEGLKQDIDENGQREDIVVWCGKLIDGRNRLRACEELQRQPSIAELDEDQDPWKYVISHNLHRRHLTTGQRSSVAAKLATLQKHKKKDDTSKDVSQDDAAKLLGVSLPSVQRAKQVQEHGSESVKKTVEQGSLPVSLAAKLVKEVPDKAEQSKVVAKGVESVRTAVAHKQEKEPVWVDVEDDEPQDDYKLEEFKKFWKHCSEVSKAAIRVWLNEQSWVA